MTGHVFHPGHEELHGVTVVIDGASGRTYVGRFHERNERGVVLNDVAVYDPAVEPIDRAAFLARTEKFGVRIDRKHLVLEPAEVAGEVTRLEGR